MAQISRSFLALTAPRAVTAAALFTLAGSAVAQPGWSNFGGGGLNNPGVDRGEAYAIAQYAGQPTFGGWFNTAGGGIASNVAQWTGTAWAPIGSGAAFSGPGVGARAEVFALAVYNGDLFAGGSFTKIGTTTIARIARWDGVTWSPVGNGITLSTGAANSGRVNALLVHNDGTGNALYAAGNFDAAGGTPAHHIARWNGSVWSGDTALGGGFNLPAYALAAYNDGSGNALFAGGDFTSTNGGVVARRVAKWRSGGWSTVGTGAQKGLNDTVRALAVHDDGGGAALYAGGKFTLDASGAQTLNRVGKWQGGAWLPLAATSGTGVGTAGDVVYALATDQEPGCPASLYVAGDFDTAGGLPAKNIARWSTGAWGAVDSGLDDNVYALSADATGTTHLIAGGKFESAGGGTALGAAKWATPDCNGNCQDDAVDIALGVSTDCNLNGVPDECQPELPVQSNLPPGIDCTGQATLAWQQRITLDRAWFQYDGDFFGGKGEGVLRWRNRPGHSTTVTGDLPLRPNTDQYTNVDTNIGEIDLGKITRSNKRHHNCDGKKTYNWKQIGANVYYDDGPDDTDLRPIDDPMTHPNLDIQFIENDRKWVAIAGFAILSAVMLVVEIVSILFTTLMFIPPIGVFPWALGLLQDAWNSPRGRDIGSLVITGAASTGVPGSASTPRGTEGDTSSYPLCPTTNRPASLATFALDDTRRNGHAHAEFNWRILRGTDTGFEGQKIIDGSADAAGLHTPAEEILRYEFFQRDGSLITSRAVFARPAECQLGWDGMREFQDERVIHFYYDIDTNQATGAHVSTLPGAPVALRSECGAEYDVRVRVRPHPDFNPVYRFTYAFVQIYAWNDVTGWQFTGEQPVRFQPLFDRIEVTVDTADIGVCEINRRIASWTTVERVDTSNNSRRVIDAAPSSALANCGAKPCIMIKGDNLCPQLMSLVPHYNPSTEIGSFVLSFSEPVRPLTNADISLTKGGSAVAFIINQTRGNPVVTLTRPGGAAFEAGQYTVTAHDSIRDLAGNQLDGDGLGGCGGDLARTFCVSEPYISGKREAGEDPVDQFAENEHAYLNAERLTAGDNVRVYVVRDGALDQPGRVLIDQTSNGFDPFLVPASGSLTGQYIGMLPFRGEYLIVIDVNSNGVYDPAVDRACDECGIALSVGEECEDAPDGIVSLWPFDESVAQPGAAEVTGAFDALAHGTPTPVPGVIGNAVSLDPGDWLEVPSSSETQPGESGFTIEFWINKPASAAGYPVVSKGPNPDATGGVFEVRVDGDDLGLTLCTPVGGGACMGYGTTGGPLTPNTWHHVAVAVDRDGINPGSVSFYVDGALHTQFGSAFGGDLDSNAPLQIAPPWPGRPGIMLDELAMWDVAADAATIGAIYQQRSHCITPDSGCPGDFNHDGGIDGADVQAYFGAWEEGLPDADVNGDGGIDGADVETFFRAWEAGGC